MKFSICIPNYNYAQYIGETIRSALDQQAQVEVLVSDNASTDGSVDVVNAIGDPRIRLSRNRWNVGFAGNLDRACAGASGDRMVLLSSDDVARPEALGLYSRLADLIGAEKAQRSVFCSDQDVLDSAGTITGRTTVDARLWADAVEDPALSAELGARVLRVPAAKLLARSLDHMRAPMMFATICYPRSLYEAVEGYGGSMVMNPDKAFLWKLLTVAEEAFHIERPLFGYRVHANNQTAQQREAGALKHLMDQYRASFDTPAPTMKAGGRSREDLARAFIEHDVALRGLLLVAEGDRVLAQRHLDFGRACYPALWSASRRVLQLRVALALGPLGTWLARQKRDRAMAAYRAGKAI